MMLTIDPPLPGFTTWTVEGHGLGFARASASERVRGRVNREILEAVMPHGDAARLLQRIAKEAPVPHTTYWIEPVLEFGHLTRSSIGGAQS